MVYPYKHYMPQVHEKCFIAPMAQIIEQVEIFLLGVTHKGDN